MTQAHIATATAAVAGTGARNSGGTARWKALINLHKVASVERTSVTGPPVLEEEQKPPQGGDKGVPMVCGELARGVTHAQVVARLHDHRADASLQ